MARDEFRTAPFYAVILKTAELCSLKQAELDQVAVYAGETQEQAQQFLATVKQTGKFPGANLRRMQAVLGYP